MTAHTYRMKPQDVAAVQWAGDNEDELIKFAGHNFEAFDGPCDDDPEATASLLTSRYSSWELVYTGDWVIKAEDGSLERWDEETFGDAWERVAADA